MEENKKSNSDHLKNAICYIPFVAIWLFFTEEKKSVSIKKHIKYWNFLFIAYILVRFILIWVLWLYFVSTPLFLIYACITGFFGYKAYKGENIEVKYIDNFEEKIKENLK